ncbi:hypothetical protein EMIT0196P_100129 [Pseudomonas chlororaphis]
MQPALPPAAGGRRLPRLAHVPAGPRSPGGGRRAVHRRQPSSGLSQQAGAAVPRRRASGRHAQVRDPQGAQIIPPAADPFAVDCTAIASPLSLIKPLAKKNPPEEGYKTVPQGNGMG